MFCTKGFDGPICWVGSSILHKNEWVPVWSIQSWSWLWYTCLYWSRRIIPLTTYICLVPFLIRTVGCVTVLSDKATAKIPIILCRLHLPNFNLPYKRCILEEIQSMCVLPSMIESDSVWTFRQMHSSLISNLIWRPLLSRYFMEFLILVHQDLNSFSLSPSFNHTRQSYKDKSLLFP